MSDLVLKDIVFTYVTVVELLDSDYWSSSPIRQIQANMVAYGMVRSIRNAGETIIGEYEGYHVEFKPKEDSWDRYVVIVKGFTTMNKFEEITSKILENVTGIEVKDRRLLIKNVWKPVNNGMVKVDIDKIVEATKEVIATTDYIIRILNPTNITLTDPHTTIDIEFKQKEIITRRELYDLDDILSLMQITDKVIDKYLNTIEVVSLAE